MKSENINQDKIKIITLFEIFGLHGTSNYWVLKYQDCCIVLDACLIQDMAEGVRWWCLQLCKFYDNSSYDSIAYITSIFSLCILFNFGLSVTLLYSTWIVGYQQFLISGVIYFFWQKHLTEYVLCKILRHNLLEQLL